MKSTTAQLALLTLVLIYSISAQSATKFHLDSEAHPVDSNVVPIPLSVTQVYANDHDQMTHQSSTAFEYQNTRGKKWKPTYRKIKPMFRKLGQRINEVHQGFKRTAGELKRKGREFAGRIKKGFKKFSLLKIIKQISELFKNRKPNLLNAFVGFINRQKRIFGNLWEMFKHLGDYMKHFKKVKTFNKKPSTFKMEVNKFADLSKDHMRTKRMGLSEMSLSFNKLIDLKKVKAPGAVSFLEKSQTHAMEPYDWEQNGMTLPVLDQLECASCWAFASSTMISAMIWAKNQAVPYEQLSPQYLLDCFEGGSCTGGHFITASIEFLGKSIAPHREMHYKGVKKQCESHKASLAIPFTDYVIYEKVTRNELYDLLRKGPIAVNIDATPDEFVLYSKGILSFECKSPNPTHALVIVGYGNENGVEYWKALNSWGESWGEKGFVKLLSSDTWSGCFIYTNVIELK